MKALITGIEGFVGPFLFKYLYKKGLQVFGTFLDQPELENPNFYFMDILNKENVNKILKSVQPDYIFHLAGFSSVHKSFQQPELCHKVNVIGTKNLLENIRILDLNCKILIISSAEVYGKPEYLPIPESHPVNPKSPYGKSRIEQEKICQEYMKNFNLDIIICRSFNHTGPGQSNTFVIPSFAQQIISVKKRTQTVISVGNLEAIRDFSDVRDVVKAYYYAITKGIKGEIYNICSGKGYSIEDLLKKLIKISKVEIQIQKDESKFRPLEIPSLIGDNTKFCEISGWNPEYKLEHTLKDILTYWERI